MAEAWGVARQGKVDDGSDTHRAYPPPTPCGYVARSGCVEIRPVFSLAMREFLVLPAFAFSDSLVCVGKIPWFKDQPDLSRNQRIANWGPAIN